MKKRIGVISSDPVVYNKIRLLLRGEYEVALIRDASDSEGCALVFADAGSDLRTECRCITLGEGGDIPLPFRHEDVLGAATGASDNKDASLTLSKDRRHVLLDGETIKLTELEYKLLEKMLRSDGFASREDLLSSVWGEGFDKGVVNVYVCYLRRKLEKNGKKVIISSRNEGYKVDEKYRRKG